jgi:hypothetical protein
MVEQIRVLRLAADRERRVGARGLQGTVEGGDGAQGTARPTLPSGAV